MEQIRISGKNLGEVALPNFCRRCFWIKLNCKLPYQIFPGIFSSIDSYTKKITNFHYLKHTKIPSWFDGFGDLGEPVKAPHHSKFNVLHEATNVLLTGAADEIFLRPDNSYFIADYKTSRFTKYQDMLFPIYEVQLNAYAYIAERTGFSPVSGLGLVYYEPETEMTLGSIDSHVNPSGFSMDFSGYLKPIDLRPEMIPPLLVKVREISDLQSPPDVTVGCKNCEMVMGLVDVLGAGG